MPKMTFIERDGTRREVDAPLGLSVLEIAHKHDVDIEGACEGSLACSTCHVIVDAAWFRKLADPTEDEEDMLDLAFGLTETSRLGCQIVMTPGAGRAGGEAAGGHPQPAERAEPPCASSSPCRAAWTAPRSPGCCTRRGTR